MAKLSIKDLDLNGKRVFIRVDFNVPLANGGQEITSDKRIRASLPTINYALEHGAGVILASHLGRPKGKPNPEMSMKPVAAKLEQLLGKPVKLAPDCVGPAVEAMLPKPGEVLLLENLRYHAEEEANDPGFSEKLAKLCDVYVNDAFGSAHRAHASTVGMIRFVKQAAAGLLMDQELKYLTMATTNPARPCVAILGGAKVSDKIEVIENLAKVVDKVLIGGAMAYTFLKSQGEPVGKSLVEDDKLDLAKKLLARVRIEAGAAGRSRGRGGIEGRRGARDGRENSRWQDGARYRREDDRGVFGDHPGREDHHLERADGGVREASVRSRHGGAGEGRGRVGRDFRGGRRRFREGDQERRGVGQDQPHFDRRRSIAGISFGNRTAGRGGADRKIMTVFLLPGLLCDETVWAISALR